jgi:hypothetical protein
MNQVHGRTVEQLAVVIEFAYERDRANIGRPGWQAPRRSRVGLDDTSRREIGRGEARRCLRSLRAVGRRRDVAGANKVV